MTTPESEASTIDGKSSLKYLVVTAIVLAIDQFTKFWVAMNLRDGDDINVIPGFLKLSYTENPGIAFGMLGDANVRWILVGVSFAAIVVVLFYLIRTPSSNRLLAFALALLAAGISGNLIDRIRMGRVIDFILAYYKDYEWPVFNVADTVITIGAALMAIELFFTSQGEKATAGELNESSVIETATTTENNDQVVNGS